MADVTGNTLSLDAVNPMNSSKPPINRNHNEFEIIMSVQTAARAASKTFTAAGIPMMHAFLRKGIGMSFMLQLRRDKPKEKNGSSEKKRILVDSRESRARFSLRQLKKNHTSQGILKSIIKICGKSIFFIHTPIFFISAAYAYWGNTVSFTSIFPTCAYALIRYRKHGQPQIMQLPQTYR